MFTLDAIKGNTIVKTVTTEAPSDTVKGMVEYLDSPEGKAVENIGVHYVDADEVGIQTVDEFRESIAPRDPLAELLALLGKLGADEDEA